MSWYFRKSYRLGSGARINFSKSGVGFSYGVKGLRLSTGPRGTYVNMGAGGIRYRQKIGGPYGQASLSTPSSTPFSAQTIPTADARQLVDANSAATLESLNARIQQPAYFPVVIIAGCVLAGLLAQVAAWLFPIVILLTMLFAVFAYNADTERRRYSLHYDLDEPARQRWNALNQALAGLSRSQRLWGVDSLSDTYDWKRNAGATSLVSRRSASLSQQAPPCIASNLTPFCLDLGMQKLFFLPDRVYVYQNRHYGAVEYNALHLASEVSRYIEDGAVPTDAVIVGSTWRYVNKDGSPDRRFSANRQLPVMNYGVVSLKSGSGLNVLLQASSLQAAQTFVTQFRQAIGIRQQPHAQNRQTHPHSQPKAPQPPRPAPSIPPCYGVLGLTPSCSQEEAAAQYRQLARDYHPDKFANFAPEFRELSLRRMQEINVAYRELKRLRGW